jgi:HEXXH motif-containing protein
MSRSPDLPHHDISPAQLDLLAAGRHDDDVSTALRDLERSRRLLGLRLVVRHTRQDVGATGPLAPVDEAWRLFVEASRARPDVVAEMLARPQVGVWSAHVLRRLRGTVEDKAPIWFHIGYLHALAATAGIRAGLRFRMSIPVRDGIVVLPGLGSCGLSNPTDWTSAVIRSDGSEFTIDGVKIGRSWRPVRNFRVGAGAITAAVHLDDVDPYRGLDVLTPPEPLTESAALKWGADLAGAWDVLTRHHTSWSRELAAGLAVIAPRPAAFRFRPHSGSVGDGFGAAIIAAPHDAVQLAVTMVHEFQHSKLNAVDHLVSLTDGDPVLDCYAPWRDDPRGTWGLFQGVYAFAAIAEFWQVQRHHSTGVERDLAHFEFALVRAQVTRAIGTLKRRRSLTPTGHRFAERIEERLTALCSAAVPENVLTAAKAAVVDHRAAWRVSHLEPGGEHVRETARRWCAGRSAPSGEVPTAVRPNPRVPRLDVKAVLFRVLLSGAGEFSAARALLGTGDDVVADATEADFALVEGDPKRARDLYLEEISREEDRPGTWSGLGLALTATTPGPAAQALLRRPELVRAVRDEVARTTGEAPDVRDLAGWLGDAPGGPG